MTPYYNTGNYNIIPVMMYCFTLLLLLLFNVVIIVQQQATGPVVVMTIIDAFDMVQLPKIGTTITTTTTTTTTIQNRIQGNWYINKKYNHHTQNMIRHRLLRLYSLSSVTKMYTIPQTKSSGTNNEMVSNNHDVNDDDDDDVDCNHRNMNQMNNRLLILGLGRVGNEVAQQAWNTNCFSNVTGTVRTAAAVNLILNRTTAVDSGSGSRYSTEERIADERTTTVRVIRFDDNDSSSTSTSNTGSSSSIVNEVMNNWCTHLLITIPPNINHTINDRLNQWYDTLLLLDNCIATNNDNTTTTTTTNKNHHCQWIGILSTTGVYGNHNGGYVTEETECRTSSSSSSSSSSTSSQLLYLQHEEMWCERINKIQILLQKDTTESVIPPPSLCIFRCAGIYNNDQSALHTIYKKMRDGGGGGYGYNNNNNNNNDTLTTMTSKNNNDDMIDITNRIHVHDLAAAVVKSMLMDQLPQQQQQQQQRSNSNTTKTTAAINICNIADDRPESRTVVMQYAKKLLQTHNITILPTTVSSNNKSNDDPSRRFDTNSTGTTTNIRNQRRRTDQKRINNTKMKHTLVQQLKFPTYMEGLDDIFHSPHQPWWTSL